MSKRSKIAPQASPRSNRRLLIHIITAPRAPYIIPSSTAFVGSIHRPGDWARFGFEACEEEAKRREQVFTLLTPDERECVTHYWRLRDE